MLVTYVTRSDESCCIDGVIYKGLPLLSTSTQILDVQSDYLRDLAVIRGCAISTVNEICKHLRTHVHVLHEAGLAWEQTNESVLRKWRNSAAGPRPSNSKKRYLNGILASIYRFLISVQRRGLIHGVVGPLTPTDTQKYLLPVEVSQRNTDGSPASYRLPLLYRTVGESDMRNATSAEVDNLFVAFASDTCPYLAERNTLIARYAEASLLRRLEITELRLNQIPIREDAMRALQTGETLFLSLVITKGMKARETVLDPQLVLDTWDFINGTRKELLSRLSIHASPELPLFLSQTSGKKLHPDSVTNLFSLKQRQACVSRGSIHHLRSKGTTDRVQNLMDMYELAGRPIPDEETLLLEVKELLGHASIETSRKYVRLERKRRQDRERDGAKEILDQMKKVKELNREIALLEARRRELKA